MRRPVLNLLLIFVLIFQGIVSAGASVMPEGVAHQEHCAGHDMQQNDCPCCPDGMASAGCTVQCSVAQASFALSPLVHVRAAQTQPVFVDRAIEDLYYAPLVPPPIRQL